MGEEKHRRAMAKAFMTLGCLRLQSEYPDANEVNRNTLLQNFGGPEGVWQELRDAKANGDKAWIVHAAVLAGHGGFLFADVALLIEATVVLDAILRLSLSKEDRELVERALRAANRHRCILGG